MTTDEKLAKLQKELNRKASGGSSVQTATFSALSELVNTLNDIIAELAGGATGQILDKASDDDYDFEWVDGSGDAENISADTTNFDGLLSALDDTVQKALDTLDDIEAADIPTDTTNFDNNLSALDDTVQKALETLDDLAIGSGTDDNAIHDNIAGEIDAIAEKTDPLVDNDLFIIEDSEDSLNKKKVKKSNIAAAVQLLLVI